MADACSNSKKRQLAVDNVHSKRRKLNVKLLQKLSSELSNEQLESAVAAICKDAVAGQTAQHTKQLLEFWEEPFSQLPEELLLLILCNAFDTRSEALQLALVCQSWHRLFRMLDFWLPWIRRTAGSDTGVRYLFEWAGLEAAVCATTRERCGRQNLWCYDDRVIKDRCVMSYYKISSFHGIAVMKSLKGQGQVYEGMMENSICKGHGTLYFTDGKKYVGEFNDNRLNGYGTYYCTNGSYARGYWMNNALHGHATRYDCRIGRYTVGNFENGKPSGYAREDDNNCTYYGHFLNGRYHGYGTIHFLDGRSYEGHFENGCFNGTGIYCWRDSNGRLETVAMSTFKNDCFHGDCIEVRVKERTVVKGRTQNDTFVGLWRYYFENGDRMCRMYDSAGKVIWAHVICENGAVVYFYKPTPSKNSALLFINYSNDDRYVARVINKIAVGSFVKQSIIRTVISPFSSVKSSAAYCFRHITFTSVSSS